MVIKMTNMPSQGSIQRITATLRPSLNPCDRQIYFGASSRTHTKSDAVHWNHDLRRLNKIIRNPREGDRVGRRALEPTTDTAPIKSYAIRGRATVSVAVRWMSIKYLRSEVTSRKVVVE